MYVCQEKKYEKPTHTLYDFEKGTRTYAIFLFESHRMLKLIASGTTSLDGLDIDSEKKTRTGENIRRAIFFLLGSVHCNFD